MLFRSVRAVFLRRCGSVGGWKLHGSRKHVLCVPKRIYIAPEFRRRGIAGAVIAALEQDAVQQGLPHAILETARTTEDSAALYTKLGYRVIPYYGSPAGAENCLCFEKNLGD